MDHDQANGIKQGSAAALQTAAEYDLRPRSAATLQTARRHDLQQALRGDWARFQQLMEEVLRAHVERQEALVRRQVQTVEMLAERIGKVAAPCSGARGHGSPTMSGAARYDDSTTVERETTFHGVLPVEASTHKAVLQPCGRCLGASAPVLAVGCGVPSALAWSRCWPSKPARPPVHRDHGDLSCQSLPVTEAALSVNAQSPGSALDANADVRKPPASRASDRLSPSTPLRRGFTTLDILSGARRKDPIHAEARRSTLSTDALQYINYSLTAGSFSTRGDVSPGLAQSTSAAQFHLEMEHGASVKRTFYKMFSNWIDWWMNLREPQRNGWLYDKVSGASFSSLCASVIILNGAVVAWATNQEMNVDVTVSPWQEYAEVGFLAFYCVELALKLWVHGMYYFGNSEWMWNVFDFFLVVASVSSLSLTVASVNFAFMRALRIFKLAKVLRVVRVMRFFSELRLILNSLLGSFVSLFWSIVMLTLIVYIFGLIFVQEAAAHIRAEGDPMLEAPLREYFGSVQDAMLTLYMAATGGDDWSMFYAEISACGPMGSVLFVFYISFIHIAVLNVLTGIFVENAMRLAVPDRETLALEHRKREITEADELRQILQEIDRDHSGTINMEEFKELISSGKVRAHLSLLGLHIKDAEMFLGMLAAAGDGDEVEIESIVQGCMRMKGAATSLDMQNLMFITKIIHKHQKRFENEVTGKLNQIDEELFALVSGLGIDVVDDHDGEAATCP